MAATGRKGKAAQFKGTEALLAELRKMGLGEVTHPEVKCWVARTMLFAHIRTMMREDLRDLQRSCLPPCEALFQLGRELLPGYSTDIPAVVVHDLLPNNRKRSSILCVRDWASLTQAAKEYTSGKELEVAILRWATDRYMWTDWFLDAVVMNVCWWRVDARFEQNLGWTYLGSLTVWPDRRAHPASQRLHGRGTLDRLCLAPPVTPYNPSMQTREEHRCTLDRALKMYYEIQEAIFVQCGYERTVLKRKRDGSSPWLHIVNWLRFESR